MSMGNWEKRLSSKKAGCFFCGGVYPATDVKEYVNELDKSKTTLCPYCEIDSVLFDVDIELSDDILNRLRAEYFS